MSNGSKIVSNQPNRTISTEIQNMRTAIDQILNRMMDFNSRLKQVEERMNKSPY